MTLHEQFLHEAIRLSIVKMESGEGGPFGAVIVKDGEIIGRGWNRVTSTNDPTAHAEVMAIRDACGNQGDFSLEGGIIYSSCEPCPMCLAAIYWARLDALYFAAGRADAADAGFDDVHLYDEISKDWKTRELKTGQLLRHEARAAFEAWKLKSDHINY